jgi:hypothetical protein
MQGCETKGDARAPGDCPFSIHLPDSTKCPALGHRANIQSQNQKYWLYLDLAELNLY